MTLCTTYAFASGANDDPSGASPIDPPYTAGSGNINHVDDPIDWWVVTLSAIGDLKFTLGGSWISSQVDLPFTDQDLVKGRSYFIRCSQSFIWDIE